MDLGVLEVERRLVAPGDGGKHRRVVVGRDRGVAAEGGERRFRPLLRLAQRLLGRMKVVLGGVEGRLGAHPLLEEILLALVELPLEGDVVGGRFLLGERLLVGGAELVDAEAGRGERRLGTGKGDAVGRRIDAEEELALGDGVVLARRDLDDAAGDVGGDGDLVLLDIGIVGRGGAPAGQP